MKRTSMLLLVLFSTFVIERWDENLYKRPRKQRLCWKPL